MCSWAGCLSLFSLQICYYSGLPFVLNRTYLESPNPRVVVWDQAIADMGSNASKEYKEEEQSTKAPSTTAEQ
jgi:hypothetical protein